MAKAPGSIKFVRKQASFGELMVRHLQNDIDAAEALSDTPEDELEDLYDDQFFWHRYVAHMNEQYAYLHDKFGAQE
jgi:hypothetical protein